jgi:hypothetical protein
MVVLRVWVPVGVRVPLTVGQAGRRKVQERIAGAKIA